MPQPPKKARDPGQPGSRADIGEGAVAVVFEQELRVRIIGHAGPELIRAAIGGLASPVLLEAFFSGGCEASSR